VGLSSLVGCQPGIFIYEYQLSARLTHSAQIAGSTTDPQTDYPLVFGSETTNTISCAGENELDQNDITKVTPIAWVIAGPFDNGSNTEAGQSALTREWNLQIEVGGGQACGRGEVLGDLTVPVDTPILPQPTGLSSETYVPDKADVLGGWLTFGADDAFEEEVLTRMNVLSTGLAIQVQTRVCTDTLQVSGDIVGDHTRAIHFHHIVQFEIEGKGQPCSESESDE